jgi:hypothetical protein
MLMSSKFVTVTAEVQNRLFKSINLNQSTQRKIAIKHVTMS